MGVAVIKNMKIHECNYEGMLRELSDHLHIRRQIFLLKLE